MVITMQTGYLGTNAEGFGIWKFDLDECGKLVNVTPFSSTKNSKYLAYNNNILYSIVSTDKGSGVVALDQEAQQIAGCIFESRASCHILVSDDMIYAANYHLGTVSRLSISPHGIKHLNTLTIGIKAGCHQVIPMGERLLIPCLLRDELIVTDRSLTTLQTLSLPAKSGPRHGVLSKDNRRFFLTGELDDTVMTLYYENGTFRHVHTTHLLNNESKVGATAAIRLTKDESKILVSTRQKNIVSILNVGDYTELGEQFSSYGDHPRDILLNKDQNFLLVANLYSGTLTSMPFLNGTLGEPVSSRNIPHAIAVCMKEN